MGSAPAVLSAVGVLLGMGCVWECGWCCGLGLCDVLSCVMMGCFYVWCDVGDRGVTCTRVAPYVGGRYFCLVMG